MIWAKKIKFSIWDLYLDLSEPIVLLFTCHQRSSSILRWERPALYFRGTYFDDLQTYLIRPSSTENVNIWIYIYLCWTNDFYVKKIMKIAHFKIKLIVYLKKYWHIKRFSYYYWHCVVYACIYIKLWLQILFWKNLSFIFFNGWLF